MRAFWKIRTKITWQYDFCKTRPLSFERICTKIIRQNDLRNYWSMYIRGFTKFGITVLWRLQFLEYLRTLHLKFQKTRTKIEVVLSLPCWLSQLNWDSKKGRHRTTSILVPAFWNFKLKVLKYSRNYSLQYTLIPWSLKKCDTP